VIRNGYDNRDLRTGRDRAAEPELSVRYRIQGIPTVKVFRGGEPVTGSLVRTW